MPFSAQYPLQSVLADGRGLLLKGETLPFANLTLVTAKRWNKDRPRNSNDQGSDVVSDGATIPILIVTNRQLKIV